MEARKVLYRARHSCYCTYHVYVYAGEMEYRVNKNKDVALKLYEMGFKRFGWMVDFLMHYANFLIQLNDDNNTRVTFEKILSLIPANQSSEIWSLYRKYENLNGNLESITVLDKRFNTGFPHADPNGLRGLVQRFSYLDLWPCSQVELSTFEGGHCSRIFEEAQQEQETNMGITSLNRLKHLTSGSLLRAKEKYVKPDLSKMVLFNPDQISNLYTLPTGETITLPAIIGQFFNALPHTEANLEGLQIDVDSLVKYIVESDIKVPEKVSETKTSHKRKRDDDSTRTAADVYRERQSVKLQKQASTEDRK
eukprot:TRINITY_DN3576_c0_g1_i4.p1 TRINITY_DN3576_c0_g1~~TRINITY_DN3576_c0_g1_i4.p1  ORF type:complete len:308 (-),score=64.22 TRINITY_DN3576_c0_g1_i4:115-1038(-)